MFTAGRAALLVLFSAAGVCWAAAKAVAYTTSTSDGADGGGGSGGSGSSGSSGSRKAITTPFDGSLKKAGEVLDHVMRLGLVVGLCVVADMELLGAHGTRTYERDYFLFVCLIMLAYAACTVKKCRTTDLLNRDQTEEWKGWMQFAFIAYHYYHALETYNWIRVFVSCYVWLTGFGNFSFFYTKADFSFVRMWRMIWRLNFTVVFLMLAMDNTYILYYIVPLHTFYFLVVYFTMAVKPGINHTKWGPRAKVAVVAVVIYVVWELPALFDKVFGFLLAMPNGLATLHDWHFRCFLDHFSTLFGMIFALNFPMASAWLQRVEALPRGREWAIKLGGLAAVLVAFVIWYFAVLPLPKLQYNKLHPFFTVIPILTWIYARNISRTLRTYHLHAFAEIGKITLETYLLQHHLLMTKNAKGILVVLPGYPKVNSVLVTAAFVLLSRTLFHVTMQLRFLLVPDNAAVAARLCVVCISSMLLFVGLGYIMAPLPWVASLLLGIVIGGATTLLFRAKPEAFKRLVAPPPPRYAQVATREDDGAGTTTSAAATAEDDGEEETKTPASSGVAASASMESAEAGVTAPDAAPTPVIRKACDRFPTVCPVVIGCVAAVLVAVGMFATPPAAVPTQQLRISGPRNFLSDQCLEQLNRGSWIPNANCPPYADMSAGPKDLPSPLPSASTTPRSWVWTSLGCKFKYIPGPAAIMTLRDSTVTFIGDSHARHMFRELAESLARASTSLHETHSDVEHRNMNGHKDIDLAFGVASSVVTLHFRWRPYLSNVTAEVERVYSDSQEQRPQSAPTPSTVVVVAAGQWDVLHHTDAEFDAAAQRLGEALANVPVHDNVGHMGKWCMTNSLRGVAVALMPRTVPTMMRDARKIDAMTNAAIARGNAVLRRHMPFSHCVFPINLDDITTGRHGFSADGVHYTSLEYGVGTQLLLNAFKPEFSRTRLYSVGGSLLWGGLVLLAVAAMLGFFDAYAGLLPGLQHLAASAWRITDVQVEASRKQRAQGTQRIAVPFKLTWDDVYGKLHASIR